MGLRTMADAERGLRTGFKLCLFIFAISMPIGIVSLVFLEDLDEFVEGFWPGGWLTYLGYAALVIFIQSLLAGVIAGLLFAVFYDRIPGDLSIKKGMVLYMLLAIFYSVYRYLVISLLGGNRSDLGLFNLILGFMLALLYGALLGYLWDRTEPTTLPYDAVPPRY